MPAADGQRAAHGAIEAVWRIEPARVIAGLAKIVSRRGLCRRRRRAVTTSDAAGYGWSPVRGSSSNGSAQKSMSSSAGSSPGGTSRRRARPVCNTQVEINTRASSVSSKCESTGMQARV
jgi:hypothetical protein